MYFNEFYDRLTDAEKKEFLNCFIERVDIYEQEQPDGRFLKHIKFRFSVFFDGKETEELSWTAKQRLRRLYYCQKAWLRLRFNVNKEYDL